MQTETKTTTRTLIVENNDIAPIVTILASIVAFTLQIVFDIDSVFTTILWVVALVSLIFTFIIKDTTPFVHIERTKTKHITTPNTSSEYEDFHRADKSFAETDEAFRYDNY